jgi:hypothetical protein
MMAKDDDSLEKGLITQDDATTKAEADAANSAFRSKMLAISFGLMLVVGLANRVCFLLWADTELKA